MLVGVSTVPKVVDKVWHLSNDCQDMCSHVVEPTDLVHSLCQSSFNCVEHVFNRPVDRPIRCAEHNTVTFGINHLDHHLIVVSQQIVHGKGSSVKHQI